MLNTQNSNLQPHPFEPFFDKDSKVLILGTFPPEKYVLNHDKDAFFYPDGRNRFWSVIEKVFEAKKDSLKKLVLRIKNPF